QYAKVMGEAMSGNPSISEFNPIAATQFGQFMGERTPANPNYPETAVSWDEAMEFCQRLSEQEGVQYTLPTEAQWEYACRAGTTTEYSFGDTWDAAASRRANPWGLYDMHGNVSEWTSSWYGAYPGGSVNDYSGPQQGTKRVIRGGSWYTTAPWLRSAHREGSSSVHWSTTRGFRVILAVQ
ncbi:MAG: formylglycine-generating enzyme family protein, partial [Candidatus Sumerlaeia bacterium]|nr:formylglycine-generating enzyme family protein [Candidatus Sumerlaeia bacterium]